MEKYYSTLPRVGAKLDLAEHKGDFSTFRHSIGHGGINKYPLPPAVVQGLKRLKPRLIRTFIQEYFNIYPAHGTYDWTALDPYMDSLAATGAQVVAAITIKPRPLYPAIDQDIIMPNDVGEWQQLIEALVRRYSIERPIVTHWEIGNEMDIGEYGGCPYRTGEPEAYNEYYRLTVEAILRAFPAAKVGGPVLAVYDHPLMEGLIKFCAETGVPLDFVSWHGYSDEPKYFTDGVKYAKGLLEKYFPGQKKETMLTEFSKWFHDARVEDAEADGLRSATVAATLLDMAEAGLDYSFYYHVWDQFLAAEQFAPFFSDKGLDNMLTYWCKTPCNFGLYDVCGQPRLIYHLYALLAKMGGTACVATSTATDIRITGAVDDDGTVRAMLVNYDPYNSRDVLAEIDFGGVDDGFKLLTIWRIDGKSRVENGALVPVERRFTQVAVAYSDRPFYCQVYLPADAVAFVELAPVSESEMLRSYG